NRCTLIHADPRFTRTSAMADIYAPLRAGSDIVFLGALIRHVLEQHEPIFHKKAEERTERERFFHDYLVHYTSAAALITEDFKDSEELNGLFSCFNAEQKKYDPKAWRYETESAGKPQEDPGGKSGEGRPKSFAGQVGKLVGPHPKQDPTLQHPR